jgi:hypothetical protein
MQREVTVSIYIRLFLIGQVRIKLRYVSMNLSFWFPTLLLGRSEYQYFSLVTALVLVKYTIRS